MKYQIDGFLKIAQHDDYENGCNPDSAQLSHVDVSFTAETIPALMLKVCEFFGVGADDMEKNACDEPGRLDIQTMETADGSSATPADIERWKRGRLELWAVTYTGTLERVETVEFPA